MKDLPIPEPIHVSTKYFVNIQATSSPGHREYSQSGKSETQKESAPSAAEQREHSTQLLRAVAYPSTSLCLVQTKCVFYTDLQWVDLI